MEIENLIEQLTKVRPEMLNEEGLKLFNTIMAILDERDKLKEDLRNSISKTILIHKRQELEYDQLENSKNIYEDRIKIKFINELLEDK